MPARGQRASEQHRARISRGLRLYQARRRAAARVLPRDLLRLRRSGTIAPSLEPLVAVAQEEAGELVDALGGPDQVAPQARAILEDAVAVGVVLRAELMRFLQSRDPDAGSRVGTLAGVRRASLMALGLERRARDVTLESYLAARSRAAEAPEVEPSRPNGGQRGSSIEGTGERASEGLSGVSVCVEPENLRPEGEHPGPVENVAPAAAEAPEGQAPALERENS